MSSAIKNEFIVKFGEEQLSPVEEWNLNKLQMLINQIEFLQNSIQGLKDRESNF